MILYINSCTRKESRTNFLAKKLLNKLGEYEEINLYKEDISPINEAFINQRIELIEKEDFTHKILKHANQFSNADTIVISAPYWDLSFPSILKVYIENIYAIGIVTTYDNNGQPKGLCKAKKLYYVTTSGGPYNEKYSYLYIKELVNSMFGIKETELIKAEFLDTIGYDANKILNDTIKKYNLE